MIMGNSMIRPLLRIMAVFAVTSAAILAATGPYRMSAADDEMLFLILAASWATIMATKPRPKRQ